MSETNAPAAAPRRRFAVLDGLRALAALAVVADHVASPTMQALTPHRAMAVDFFFVLSGFVVLHAYEARLTGPNSIGALGFIRVRLVRFWPMLLAAVALGALVLALLGADHGGLKRWLGSLTLNLSFLPTPPSLSLLSWSPFPLDGPSYSMFFELTANLALAFIISRLTALRLGLIIAISGAVLAWLSIKYELTTAGWNYENFWAGFPRVMFSFFVGVALYRIWRTGRVPAMPAWAAFLLLLAAFCVPASGRWFAPYEVFAGFIVFPLIVLFAAGAEAHGAAERIMLRLGALSYGFYLLQAPLNELLNAVVRKLGMDPAALDLGMYVFVVGSALVLTAIVERWYEIPFRKLLARRLLLRRV